MFYCNCIFIRSSVHIDSPRPVTWSQTVSQPVTTAPLDTLVDAVRGTSPSPLPSAFPFPLFLPLTVIWILLSVWGYRAGRQQG